MIDEFRIELNMEQVLCNTCKKINPEYYEMKLQLKFKYFDNILELKEQCMKILMDNFTTINKIEVSQDWLKRETTKTFLGNDLKLAKRQMIRVCFLGIVNPI